MGDLAAAVIRGQLRHLQGHIAKKKALYERYREKLEGGMGLVSMIPIGEGTCPNYWMPCMACECDVQALETRSERKYTYIDTHGETSPMEIYDALAAFGAESGLVYKPMSMQPAFDRYEQITLDGRRQGYQEFYNDRFWVRCDRARDIYERGLCLPGDTGMTPEEQDRVIDIIYACFDRKDMQRIASVG